MPDTLEAKFWSKVDKSAGNGCWQWTGASNGHGYGRLFTARRISMMAHRFAYQLVKGEIPSGAVLDHLCRKRMCVNPDHLEAVSQRTNILRGIGPTAFNARTTHCKRGHELTPDNLRYTSRGYRNCLTCTREVYRKNDNVARIKKRAAIRQEIGNV